MIIDGRELKLNGGSVKLEKNVFSISQPDEKLNKQEEKALTEDQLVAKRARGFHIAAVCHLESYFDFCYASQISNPESKDTKKLKKSIEVCTKNYCNGLEWVPFDLESIVMAIFFDAEFATNPEIFLPKLD